MKTAPFRSFRRRLNRAFLAVSLIPMLLCATLMLEIFRSRMESSAREASQYHLAAGVEALDTLSGGLSQVMGQLSRDPVVCQALFREEAEDSQVYDRLFSATEPLRGQARFDLYDISGTFRYSTQAAPEKTHRKTGWGILRQAAQAGPNTLVYAASDGLDGDAPLLAAALLADGYGAPVGYLVISLSDAQLGALLADYADQGTLALLDGHWHSIYCTQPEQGGAIAGALRGQLLGGKALTGAGPDSDCLVARHEETGLTLALEWPRAFTQSTWNLLYTVGILCALVCVGVSVILGLQLSRQMYRPIDALHRGFRQVEKNNLHIQVSLPKGQRDELTELTEQFNHMVTTLRRNQRQLLQNQQQLNEAQIRMLQAQLNPHFLCNTLDTMKWISKINQVPQVAEMSTNLADILRFCISPAEFVPLRKELEILERYLDIQRIRLSDSFTYCCQVPERLQDCLVPKMLLQPLAENAVLHGLSGRENGQLVVSARKEGTVLEIRVCDNGQGLPESLLGPYRPPEAPTGHLGLMNVDTILRKHYGEDFGLVLENRPDSPGACILARLPMEGENPHAENTGC